MKKLKLMALLLVIVTSSCAKNSLNNAEQPDLLQSTNRNLSVTSAEYELVFVDEFESVGSFDTSKWSYAKRWHPAWAKYLTASQNYVNQSAGNLLLRLDNAVIPGDDVPYHSGGIQTTQKFSFTYGKVEVRAKFKQGQGSWPAIWMMPEDPVSFGNWPNSGEIDIMEHVNYENHVHQTIHSGAVTNANGGSTATHHAAYNVADYNTYGIVWEPTKIDFFVNGVLQYTYTKPANATTLQWPFDKPFYLILNQAGGAGWPGAIVDADLPFEMQVDYIRVYKKPEFESGAVYKIFSALNNSSVLDVEANRTADNSPVLLWTNNTPNTLNQQWKLTNVGQGMYKIQPTHALTKALQASNGSATAGSALQIFSDNASAAQKWIIRNVGADYYTLSPANASAMQIEIAASSATNGSKVQLGLKTNATNQNFKIVKQ